MIVQGNSIRIPLRDESVHAIVTSPPYWNLRDYSTGKWVGGSGECDHKVRPTHNVASSTLGGGKKTTGHWQEGYKDTCLKCGATRIDNQIGLEPTIAAYLAVMVQVFREVWRVLRPDGVCWVNMGDSYSGGKNGRSAADTKAVGKDDRTFRDKPFSVTELPAKNLCMIPARVAIALQEDGWILRSAIPWIKSNPMPESVRDRPGTAHEHVFMLVKSSRYYWDMEAVRRGNAAIDSRTKRGLTRVKYNGKGGDESRNDLDADWKGQNPSGRALRTSDPFFDSLDAYIAHLQDVRDNGGILVDSEGLPAALVVNTESYKAAHYATFAPKLISPLIKTTPEKVCPCGAPWVRVTEKGKFVQTGGSENVKDSPGSLVKATNFARSGLVPGYYEKHTTGWQPTCKCNNPETIPAVIFDPFCGSGTVGQVARELGRRFIGIDLSATYLQENALPRAEKLTSQKSLEQLPMFATSGSTRMGAGDDHLQAAIEIVTDYLIEKIILREDDEAA